MINNQILSDLKNEYGNEIYSITLDKKDYVFRALTSKEYENFSDLHIGSADLEDLIVLSAVIYPDSFNIDKIRPGTVSALSDEILEMSGFTSIELAIDNLETAREQITNAIEMMKAFVLAAMPSYRYDELGDLTLKALSKLVAISEVILQIHSGAAQGQELKITLGIPQEEEAEQSKSKKKFDFTIEDIEKANRATARDKAFKDFDAPPTDPVAQKLWQALQ